MDTQQPIPALPSGYSLSQDDVLPDLPNGYKVVADQKKNPTPPVSKSGGQLFGSGSNPLPSTVNTKQPSVLTDKGKEVYKEQVVDSQSKKQKLSEGINAANSAYSAAQGNELTEEIETHKNKAIADPAKQVGNLESVGNTFDNFVTSLKGVVPRLNMVAADAFEKVVGKDITGKLNSLPRIEFSSDGIDIVSGRTTDEIRGQAIESLDFLQTQTQPTADIINNTRNFNIPGMAAGLVDAVGGLAATIVPSMLSGGSLLVTEMVGGSLYDYNSAKAAAKGVTTQELYKSGDADFGVPAAIGSLAFGMERLGLKGFQKAINKQLIGSGFKKALLLTNEWNQEGWTEWVQVGLDAGNLAIANGLSVEDAAKSAAQSMFSVQGAEAYAKGFVGSGAASGGIRLAKTLINPKNKAKAEKFEEQRNQAWKDMASENVPPEAKQAIVDVLENTNEQIDELVNNDRKETENLDKDQVSRVDEINAQIAGMETAINHPNISDSTKSILEKQKQELEIELDKVLKQEPKAEAINSEPAPEVDTEAKIAAEAQEAETKFKNGGDQVDYEQKMKELDDRANNLPKDETINNETSAELTTEQPNEQVVSELQAEPVFEDLTTDLTTFEQNNQILNEQNASIYPTTDVDAIDNQITDVPDADTVLDKAELDLRVLKSVKEKQVKYDASIKRLEAARESGIISELEFTDFQTRFDNVMSVQKPKRPAKIEQEEQEALAQSDIEAGEQFSIDDEITVSEDKKSYHAEQKDKAVSDIKTQWQKLGVVGIADDPIQRDQDVVKLFDAVARYTFHSIMDGSIKLKGRIADRVDEIVKRLGIVNLTDEQYEKITEIVKNQAEKAKGEVRKQAPTLKAVIKKSTQVKSDFKQKDLISRLSQFKMRLAAEVRGSKRGVKEGVSLQKEKSQANDDIIGGLRNELKLQIKEAKDSGLISNRIKPQTFVNAVNRLNNAKTPMQILKAIDYMSKVFGDIDYDNHLIEANSLRNQVKKLAKRKGLPSNIAAAMRNIARAVPSELGDLKEYNTLMTSVIDNVKGESITGINTGVLNDVAEWLAKEQQRQLKERYELLIGEQSGFSYEEKTLEQMKAEIDELSEEGYEEKDNRRDADEAVSELLREEILEAELDDYNHPQEIEAIKALREVDLAGLSDRDLKLYNIAVKNLILNGKLNGVGTIVSVAKKQKNFKNIGLIAEVQRSTRAVSAIADNFRKNWATIPTQLKSFMNSDRALAKYLVITGLSDVKSGYTKVAHRMQQVEKGVEAIIRKNKGLRDNPERQIEVAVYADLNQYEEGLNQTEIQEQFDGRKIALLETIDRLKTKSDRDTKFKKEHANYIKLVESVYQKVKALNSIEDFKLDADQKELYTYMRDYYDSIQEDTRLNAEIFNNINFSPVNNYFPRTYNKIDDLFGSNAEKQMESKLLGESIFYNRVDLNREESGAKRGRTIKKDQLPADKVINLDLVSNFLNTTRNILYDIETQPGRQYTASVLTSEDMRQLTNDDSSIEITQRVARQLVRNQRLGILPQHAKSVGKALKEFYRGMGNRFALGGVTQLPKQAASSFVTTSLALGENVALLPHAINELVFNNEAATKLMSSFAISRRAEEKSALTHVSIKESDVNKLNRSLEKYVVRGIDGWNDFSDYMSLSPLIWGDAMSAKSSWIAFYIEYLIKEGIIKSREAFDLNRESENPNQEAAEYSNLMTETTLNISDRTQQPEFKLGGLFPFTSFAINSKANMFVDLARASRKGIPMEERIKAARMVGGHILSSIVLNQIALGIRMYMIYETVQIVDELVRSDEDEKEEEKLTKYLQILKDEMFERNSENSRDYMIKDIIFGGMLSQFTDPIYSSAKEAVTGEQEYSRPSDIISMLGIYGIPAKAVIQLGEKANNLSLTDDQFIRERFGIEAADGSKVYIPKDDRGEERPDWAKKSMSLSVAINAVQILSSASSQEMGAISRRLPGVIKKLEDKKYGAKRKFKPEAVEKAFTEITKDGVTYLLDQKQLEFRMQKKKEWLSDWYETIKDADTSDKESEQTARERSNKYSADQVIYEYGLDVLKKKE